MSESESALEELYSADPSEFTKKRDALAKQLKAGGDKDGAAAVAARRKPTQMAWVLNQLARREPAAIADLVDVGRELAREQRRALRGEPSSGLRESIERQRKTIGTLAQKTTALMKKLGVDPSAHLEEITSALQAALVDPVVGAQLEEGRLEKTPAAAAGFGGPVPDEPIAPRVAQAAAPVPKPKHASAPKHDHAAEAKAKAEAAAAESAAAEAAAAEAAAKKRARAEHAKLLSAAESELKEAESAAKRARHAAQHAEKEAKVAIERAKKLAADADAKESAAADAEKAVTRLTANTPAD